MGSPLRFGHMAATMPANLACAARQGFSNTESLPRFGFIRSPYSSWVRLEWSCNATLLHKYGIVLFPNATQFSRGTVEGRDEGYGGHLGPASSRGLKPCPWNLIQSNRSVAIMKNAFGQQHRSDSKSQHRNRKLFWGAESRQ